MCGVSTLVVDLKGLTDDTTVFRYSLNDDYFKVVDAPDVRRGSLECVLTVRKGEGFFNLDFHTEGYVLIPCDRCLADMEQPISTDDKVVVKFGAEYSDEDDFLTVSEEEGVLDISWLVYEFVALNIPIKHVHAAGMCDAAMERLLEEHSANYKDSDEGGSPDPRWSKLMELTDKN